MQLSCLIGGVVTPPYIGVCKLYDKLQFEKLSQNVVSPTYNILQIGYTISNNTRLFPSR